MKEGIDPIKNSTEEAKRNAINEIDMIKSQCWQMGNVDSEIDQLNQLQDEIKNNGNVTTLLERARYILSHRQDDH